MILFEWINKKLVNIWRGASWAHRSSHRTLVEIIHQCILKIPFIKYYAINPLYPVVCPNIETNRETQLLKQLFNTSIKWRYLHGLTFKIST